jgi:hypothetical protein
VPVAHGYHANRCDELSVQCGGSSSVNRTPKLQIILRIRLDVRQAGRYPRPNEFDKLLLMVFWFMQHTDIQSAREGNLCLRKIAQPTNGTERPRQKSRERKESLSIVPADCCSRCRRDSPCTPSNDFSARRAVPDSDGGPLYCVLQILRKIQSVIQTACVDNGTNLATEGAGIPCVLGYFHPFYLLAQGGTVTLHKWLISSGRKYPTKDDDVLYRTFR